VRSPDARSFFVHGLPATQGSKRLVRLRNGRSVMIESSKHLGEWRQSIAVMARGAEVPLHEVDVLVSIQAIYLRPESHFKRDGSLRSSAAPRPGYADCDKLARAVCDALAGIAYRNDRQVALLAVERMWADDEARPGAYISIAPAPPVGVWGYWKGA